MASIVSREIRLKSHPVGMPEESDFELIEVAVPEPKIDEILVQNIYMSVDPYMRGGMRSAKLNEALSGGCVGKVVKANSDRFQVGDYVLGMLGWREFYVVAKEKVTKIDPAMAPIQSFLGTVGMP